MSINKVITPMTELSDPSSYRSQAGQSNQQTHCAQSLYITIKYYLRFESLVAYNGELDGFDVTRKVLIVAKHLLKPSGILWLETFKDFPARIKDFVVTTRIGA